MRVYQCKADLLTGTDFHEVWQKASFIYKKIKKRSKRQPYLRSTYFKKQKVFLGLFWDHLFEKPWPDRLRRLRYFATAVELIEHSPFDSSTKEEVGNHGVLLHRFIGRTKSKESFVVQIKEDKSSGKKYLISIFPNN